jgi:hypothetical protein
MREKFLLNLKGGKIEGVISIKRLNNLIELIIINFFFF